MGAEPIRGGWRRRWWLGAVVLIVLVVAGWALRPRGGRPAPDPGARESPARGAADRRVAPWVQQAPPEIRLEALDTPAPTLDASGRNPFRFQAPAAPPPGARAGPMPAPVAGAGGGRGSPAPSPPAPGPPPIPLKFIGVVEAPGVGKIAALSDGKFVYHGREGEIIDGRYRIVRIGVESIVVEYADGRGRQTIRLTG